MTSRATQYALPILWVILGILLSGCQATTPGPRLIGPPAQLDLSPCGGNLVLPLVGQNVSVLPASGGWGALRVIYPGMAVTEDYSESRLNIQVDAQGTILGVSCG